jgi:hypothetical protein
MLRKVGRRLQQDRRLADARLAAEQNERAGDKAAAQDTVELVDAGRDSFADDRFDLVVQAGSLGPRGTARQRVSMSRRAVRRRTLFDK